MSREAAPAGPVAFGRYTLLERLAVGGMAEVFRAKITSSHGFEKVLVVKRILPHLAADPGFVAMFIDEAKLTAQLTHPKIVQILDFGEVNGQYFTALEFIDGFDALGLLRTAAAKRVRIPPALAVFIVQEMLEALDYAHNARDMEGKPMQIVHRDISPSNIFISKRGDVKLGDFGIAHAKRRESKTQAGTLKGKYGYMSPEQVVGRPIDARSDLFAVGVVLAELLTGRRLFSAPADLDVLLKVRDVHLERLDKYGADLPRELDRIVRRALKKDPNERPQTAAELHEELGDYLFSAGERVGPADLRLFSGTLLSADPETAARLLQDARRAEKGRPAAAPAPRDARTGAPTPPEGSPTAAAPAGVPTVSAPPAQPIAGGPAAATDEAWQENEHSSARRFTPVSRPGDNTGSAVRTGVRPGHTKSDIGRFVSAAPKRPPDSAGEISVITPMRLFCDLALAGETGLLLFSLDGVQKEIFLVAGAPESVSSSEAGERFGEYLVGRGVLGPPDLELALGMLPHYNGKVGDTLVALGMLRPLDVFRLLSEQVRDRVIDVFAWTEGTFAFYRGVTNRQESFPLGLDTFEILGAGVVSLPEDQLAHRFEPLDELRPLATGRGRVYPEAFKIGPTPREVMDMLDGERTVQAWLDQFTDPDERLTFLRALYILVETDLAELD
ncbi:MAG TPA: protein kinase [Polyangia bacterium]|jgi:serine/threonine-protein kinase|nr:protein kinase [Polyangia bacterium]